jgi:phosphoglycolate phosphatase-like HAD superfamily hydrolase
MLRVFDVDGILYDGLPLFFEIDDKIRAQLGYDPISIDEYRRKYQTNNWRELYRSLGIREEDISEVIETFEKEILKAPPPMLIPGARKVLRKAVMTLGLKNVFIVTNEQKENMKKKFERDGLTYLLPKVINTYEEKTDVLYELGKNSGLVYIADLVSDGEACLRAREKGAENIMFWGMVHEYACNHPDMIRAFVDQHQDFARTVDSLEELEKILI